MCGCGATCGDDCVVCCTGAFSNPLELGCTLVDALTPVVDGIRNIATDLGARPYAMFMIWTRWSDGKRGAGTEDVIRCEQITPTPKIVSLDGIEVELLYNGALEKGSVQVSEISPRYTEAELSGTALYADDKFPPEVNFYYEVRFKKSIHWRRFTLSDLPTYDAVKAQWSMRLVKANVDRKNGRIVR